MIREDAAEETQSQRRQAPTLAGFAQTAANLGSDHCQGPNHPVWFFVADWFPIYLVAKAFLSRAGFWPFGFHSSPLIWEIFLGELLPAGSSSGAGRSVRRAKRLLFFGGIGVLLLIPTIFTNNLYAITLLFALSTFSYASFSTIANVLPSDLFFSRSVATVSGLSGTGAGIGTIVAFKLIGYFSDMPMSPLDIRSISSS